MVTSIIKQAVSSAEFKRIVRFEDVKSTLSSLNYIFNASMLFLAGIVLRWMFILFSWYLFLIPVGYFIMCYIGRFVELVVNIYKKELDKHRVDVD